MPLAAGQGSEYLQHCRSARTKHGSPFEIFIHVSRRFARVTAAILLYSEVIHVSKLPRCRFSSWDERHNGCVDDVTVFDTVAELL